MPCILGGKALTFEHMPQMTLTMSTDDFDSAPIGIWKHFNVGIDHVIEGRPSATRIELIG